jgi:hypothetical protein
MNAIARCRTALPTLLAQYWITNMWLLLPFAGSNEACQTQKIGPMVKLTFGGQITGASVTISQLKQVCCNQHGFGANGVNAA